MDQRESKGIGEIHLPEGERNGVGTSGTDRDEKSSLIGTIQDETAEDPVTTFESTEIKDILAGAIERLPEREKTVIALYYYEGLTLKEIGQVLGVTESRVSQLHTKAVLRLRARLQAAQSYPA
jgi:RNA polymerase sigma factor for flagellar operon FliA